MEDIIKEIRKRICNSKFITSRSSDKEKCIKLFNDLIKENPAQYESLVNLSIKRLIYYYNMTNCLNCIFLSGGKDLWNKKSDELELLLKNSNYDTIVDHSLHYGHTKVSTNNYLIDNMTTDEEFYNFFGEKWNINLDYYLRHAIPLCVNEDLMMKILERNNIVCSIRTLAGGGRKIQFSMKSPSVVKLLGAMNESSKKAIEEEKPYVKTIYDIDIRELKKTCMLGNNVNRNDVITIFNKYKNDHLDRYENLIEFNLKRIFVEVKENKCKKCLLLFGNYSKDDQLIEDMCVDSNYDTRMMNKPTFWSMPEWKRLQFQSPTAYYNYTDWSLRYIGIELTRNQCYMDQLVMDDEFDNFLNLDKNSKDIDVQNLRAYCKLNFEFIVDIDLIKKILDKNNIRFTCTPYYKLNKLGIIECRNFWIDGYILNIDMSTIRNEGIKTYVIGDINTKL
uniref:Uncharacterized protein n=1 Tax=viral metagenome TaxID=1070528 RepID=A0A6C0EDT9_9ZZZZ